MSRVEAVLFDWGDTLFRSPDASAVIVEASRERGVRVSVTVARALWDELWAAGKTPAEHAKGRDLSARAHRAVWMDLFARADSVAPGLATALYERVMDPGRWLPYADTEPTLRALRSLGIKTAVVSNIGLDIRPLFARHALGELIDAYALSFEQGVTKPDPRLFLAACAMVGARPEDSLMVGDDPVTDGAAAAAGLRVFVLPDMAAGRTRGLARVLDLLDG